MRLKFLVAALIVLMGCSSPQEEEQKDSPQGIETKENESSAESEPVDAPQAAPTDSPSTPDQEAVLSAISRNEDSLIEEAVKQTARNSRGEVQNCEVKSQAIISLSSSQARFKVYFTCHIQSSEATKGKDVSQTVEGTATQKDGEWVVRILQTVR